MPKIRRPASTHRLFPLTVAFVDHFLLNDLVDDDTDNIRFCLPFDNFDLDALPATVAAYREMMQRSIDFVRARNKRIARNAATHLDH